MPAAIARLFGTREWSRVADDFAFCFAMRLLTFQTAQPSRAFRLFNTLMGRGYPSGQSFTQKPGRRPPERRPVERGVDPGQRGGTGPNRPRTKKTPRSAETYALLSDPLFAASSVKKDESECGSETLARARRTSR